MRVKKFTKNKSSSPEEDIHFYNINLLDASGSMFYNSSPTKYSVAYDGIREDAKVVKEELKKYPKMSSTIGFAEFTTGMFNWVTWGNARTAKIPTRRRRTGGGTPLHHSIIHCINYVIDKKNPEDKVVLKIMTDGQDTQGGLFRRQAAEAIQDAQDNHNFTVTFIGTELDVARVEKDLNIDESNTLIHQNTANSIVETSNTRGMATMDYMDSMSKGLEVKVNFYKSFKEK